MLEQGKWGQGAPKPSEEFHNRFEESLKLIEKKAENAGEKASAGAEIIRMDRKEKRRIGRLKKAAVGCTAAAAAMEVFIGVCYQNPVWASNLPLIGHIFERMEGKLAFGENYKDYAEPLDKEAAENQESGGQESGKENSGQENSGQSSSDQDGSAGKGAFTRTVDGTTVSMSESYCSGSALYLSLVIESEEPFQDTLLNRNGQPSISVRTTENYSFNPQEQSDLVYLEGEFLDENTYAGVMRIDLNMKNTDNSELQEKAAEAEANGEEFIVDAEVLDQYSTKLEIPEQFTLNLDISQIIGDLANPDTFSTGYTAEELEAMSDEEWNRVMTEAENEGGWNSFPNSHENWWMEGSWQFELDITADPSKTQTAEVDQMNEAGAGIANVVKTPFEITVNELYDDETKGVDYFPVILDAQGKVMDVTAGSVNTVSVKNHDTSTVYVYLCDYDEYMDELKGRKQEDGFKGLMDEKAKFAAEVHFD